MQDLIQFCQTDRQRQIIEAMIEHGSERKAAAAIGSSKTTVNDAVSRVKKYAALKGVDADKSFAKSAPAGYRKHFVIPDVQAKPGVPLKHLEWAGRYAAEKRPDVIVCIGDFADMPSLSLYDRGKKSFEGRRYKADIEAAHRAMELLMRPIVECEGYSPELILTLGNHEHRITRAVDDDSRLEGTIGLRDLGYEVWGWEVIPYLEPRVVDGICYSHFFTSGVMGRPVASARTLLNKKHMSCIMGHVQKRDIDCQYDALGKRITSIFAGAFYQHDEEYLGPQGNAETWRGVWILNEVKNGEFDEMPVSLDYLRRRYG